MKSSAVSLSDKLIVSAANHRSFKTWILSESQTLVFEGIELFFEKSESWFLRINHKVIECVPETSFQLSLGNMHQIEFSFDELSLSYLNPGLLILDDTLVIGSDYVNDGITEARFHEKEVTLVRDGTQISYSVEGDSICAVNGKIAPKQGCISVPSLIESGFLKVFVGESCVVFNQCVLANLRAEEIKKTEIKPFYYQYLQDHYIHHEKIDAKILEMPEFPALPANYSISLLSMGPMLTMSCASFLTAWLSYQNSGNQTALIMPSMMIFSAVFWPVAGALFNKVKHLLLKRKRRKQYLHDCSVLIEETKHIKKRIRDSKLNPEMLDSFQYWQVRSEHPQFLHLPLGYGDLPKPIQLKPAMTQPDFTETECLKRYNEVIKECSFVERVLIEVDLKTERRIALISSLRYLDDIALKVILMMGCMHDLKSVHYVLFCDDENFNWKFRTTPLFQAAGRHSIFDETVSLSECEKRITELLRGTVVCFVLNRSRFEHMSARIRQKCHVVYFIGHNELIPTDCAKIYRINGNGVVQSDNLRFNLYETDRLKEILHNCHTYRQQSFLSQKTSQLDFLSLYPVLNEKKILENWRKGMEPIGILGIDENDELIELNLSEHQEGPHGLIAGMTGSGKSVLLLSFLLSLAIRCSPEDLQMLVIDYKGGTLFQQLQSKDYVLPHLCGWLSNQSSYIGRTLASISYECSRRQKLFEKASSYLGRTIADIQEYRTAHRSHPEISALSNLLIIVDEFAELKKEEPQFLKTLISLSRIGRSLGLHLILSTQKISGVVDDEIIGNARFKIGLRVSRASESKELLGCEDASMLKKAGEFVLVSDQRTIKGQSPYCLAPIYDYPKVVSITDSCGSTLKTSKKLKSDVLRQNEKIVTLLKKAANSVNLKSTPLWLPPLRKRNALGLLKPDQILIGMVDYPEIRTQKTMVLDPEQHLLIGYQNKSQRNEILEFFLRQLLYLGTSPVYYVQLVSKIRPSEYCVQPDKDQMDRFLKKMSSVQEEKTVVIVDDLVEFMEYFESVSALNSFLFKAVQRKIQCIFLLRAPFSVSGLTLDQFASKVIFADINDSESMNLFRVRRETNRITSLSQGYTLVNEKLCVLQLESLPETLKENAQLQRVRYMPETLIRPNSDKLFAGVSIESLSLVEIKNSGLILTGVDISELKEYALRIDPHLERVEILDSFQLNENYSRKSILNETVLWVGGQFHLQMLFMYDTKTRLPKSNNEGILIRNGKMECLRLFDK